MSLLLKLLLCFWEFFKTGLFAVGGGLATIPFLQDMAEKHPDWFTSEELTGFIAISESTPGPIGINIATYAGYNIAGPIGSIVCTFGLVLPSFLIVLIIARALNKFKSNELVQGAFYGIRPASTALICGALLTTFSEVLVRTENITSFLSFFTSVDYVAVLLFAVILVAAIFLKKLHPIVFIAAGAVAGIIFKM